MTVAELIKALEAFDPDVVVSCNSQDDYAVVGSVELVLDSRAWDHSAREHYTGSHVYIGP